MVFTTRSPAAAAAATGSRPSSPPRIAQKNSRPNHPTTCGKVERFQQTLKKWLTAQPDQPTTIDELQALLDHFVEQYNQHRPHRSLPHRATPAASTPADPKPPRPAAAPTPTTGSATTVSTTGKVTLRHDGRLHSIGIGRTHAGTRVLILVHDLDIRIINAATGELLRDLALDPTKRYQGTGRPPGPPRKQTPNPRLRVRPSGMS